MTPKYIYGITKVIIIFSYKLKVKLKFYSLTCMFIPNCIETNLYTGLYKTCMFIQGLDHAVIHAHIYILICYRYKELIDVNTYSNSIYKYGRLQI